MHRRLLIALVAGGVATLTWSATALAGGWAVTTLDSLPEGMRAGETYRIGYTIRQHGSSPFSGATPAIRIYRTGAATTFAGRPDGTPGHYVSDVTFPADGEWSWTALQEPFQPQPLGSIT